MGAKSIILSCAFWAILIAYLSTGEAVSCAEEPDNVDCVDCTDELNADYPECLGEDDDDEETPATDGVGAATRPRRRRRRLYPGGRPGWRPGGWPERRPARRPTRRPTTILGRIIEKKMNIIG